MKTTYRDREKVGNQFHPNPVLDNIYRRRGVSSLKDISYPMANMIKPNFKGMEDAVSVIVESLKKDDRIMVVADYDCDGATSCAIAVEGLRMLGFSDVRFMVPDRFTMGYGLSPAVVDFLEPHKPDLVVTVDNGISAFEGCEAVKNLSHPTKLVVTDHHLGGESNPTADAIVNPNQKDCPFPSKALAGCGMIFYTLLSINSKLKEENWYSLNNKTEPDLKKLIDLLALGTVADVVPLDYNNRIFVWHGINRIRKGLARPGVQALADISKVDLNNITSTDFGFALGPRINSAGRLEDMTIGINCLLAETYEEAMTYAQELEDLNIRRKELTAEISHDAYKQLDLPEDMNEHGLCVFGEDFNEGVIGIVASRLKENYHRPVIVFTRAEDGSFKGSGRSVDGVHLRDVLVDVDRRTEGRILMKFGGHAMAAGMSLRSELFEEFKTIFDEEVKKYLPSIEPAIDTDGILESEHLNLETAYLIENSGPWGQHFQKPLFRGDFVITERRVVGGRHLKMKVRPVSGGFPIDAICFFCLDSEDALMPENTVIRMAYELSINKFRGNETLQLMVKDFDVNTQIIN